MKKVRASSEILDYHHKSAKRKNNPEEGLAIYLPEEKASQKYSYDPHLDPQLVWSGKGERASFDVPVVPLHIHERVSPRSIVGALEKKRSHQLRLFDETNFPLDKRVDFYKHDIDWANRLILGDSLLVMNSLLTKEFMAGKVQMIYIDPPYGINYTSNFQASIRGKMRDADDNSLTREVEQIRAYRDTWSLGIHSYLTYLRDRFLLAHELLNESGSLFVQISDENVHLIRNLLDEIFLKENFVSLITFRKKGMPLGSSTLERMSDYLVWYAKDISRVKYRKLFTQKDVQGASRWNYVDLPDGSWRFMTSEEWHNHSLLPKNVRIFTSRALKPSGYSKSMDFIVEFQGKKYNPPYGGCWMTTPEGMQKLIETNRIIVENNSLRAKLYLNDYPVSELTNLWDDTSGASDKMYVVQTMEKVIQRCILMSTDPGDLVFDPTCGSGTTAYSAEQWGRRWITCDTSRIALAIAKQRLMTAVFPYYVLAQPQEGIRSGFVYKTVPHVTLSSIIQSETPFSLSFLPFGNITPPFWIASIRVET